MFSDAKVKLIAEIGSGHIWWANMVYDPCEWEGERKKSSYGTAPFIHNFGPTLLHFVCFILYQTGGRWRNIQRHLQLVLDGSYVCHHPCECTETWPRLLTLQAACTLDTGILPQYIKMNYKSFAFIFISIGAQEIEMHFNVYMWAFQRFAKYCNQIRLLYCIILKDPSEL